MKISSAHKAFEYFFDNLFDIITILIAGYLVVRHQVKPFGPDESSELLTWILAVLGLLAVSGLWERNRRLNRIEKVSTESRDLVLSKIKGTVTAKDFFIGNDKKPSEQNFSTASEIFLSGMTLTRTTREYVHILGERLKAGAYIKFMILEPKLPLMEELVLRSFGDTTSEYWKTRIGTVVDLINVIAKTPGSKGKLVLGFLPFIPSYGFILLDQGQPHASCFIELYHHKSAISNPTFMLNPSEDPYWYKFFQEQFEIMWNSCRIVEMPMNIKKE